MDKKTRDATTDIVGRVIYNLLNLIPANGPTKTTVKAISKDLWQHYTATVDDPVQKQTSVKNDKCCRTCYASEIVKYQKETFRWCKKLGRKVEDDDVCKGGAK